jgi:hypothetical protein
VARLEGFRARATSAMWRVRFAIRERVLVMLNDFAAPLIATHERDVASVAPAGKDNRVTVELIKPPIAVLCSGQCGRVVKTTTPGIPPMCFNCTLEAAK